MGGGDKKKILVIKLGALGDFIQALGPMAAIRRYHQDDDIILLTTAPFVTLARASGYFDHVWTDERPRWCNPAGWLALMRRLGQGGFARVYDLQNNDRTGLYFRLMRPRPEWVGSARGASHRNDSPQRTAGSAFDGHVQTLARAGIKDIALDRLDWVRGDIARYNIPAPFILLVPGSAPGRPEKRWPAHHFATLARTLYGWGYTPVVIGTLSEREAAAAIGAAVPAALDLTGETALSDIALLARAAAAAIGNDTGPMHIIGPTGCPSYVLFSRHSDPQRHAPLGENIKIIDTADMDSLSPNQVIEHLRIRDFHAAAG